MRRHSIAPSTLTWCLLLTVPLPTGAQTPSLFQELGGSFVVAQSENVELPSPRGFRVSSVWTFGGSWLARFSVHRLSDRVEKEGQVCTHYIPHVGCRMELTETTSTLTGVQATFMRIVHRGRWNRVGMGGGVSFTELEADLVGESGLTGDLLAPKPGQVGFLGTLSLAILPVPAIPLVLDGGFTAHWVWFRTCSGETPRQYDPFCKGVLFRELEVGLSFLF